LEVFGALYRISGSAPGASGEHDSTLNAGPGPMTHPALIERITRSLAYMLRHQPEEFDLEVDEFGYAEMDDVVQALNERLGEPVEEEDIREAVTSGDRQRYEIVRNRIRALYGHSIDVQPGEPGKPPSMLYVGVSRADADRAQRFGLRAGRRRFLHLALSPEDAIESGRRAAVEYVVITVHALDAWEEGINFYDRKSLFLSDPIPTDFLEVGELHTDGVGNERHERDDRGPRHGRRGGHDRGHERGGQDRGGHDRGPRREYSHAAHAEMSEPRGEDDVVREDRDRGELAATEAHGDVESFEAGESTSAPSSDAPAFGERARPEGFGGGGRRRGRGRGRGRGRSDEPREAAPPAHSEREHDDAPRTFEPRHETGHAPRAERRHDDRGPRGGGRGPHEGGPRPPHREAARPGEHIPSREPAARDAGPREQGRRPDDRFGRPRQGGERHGAPRDDRRDAPRTAPEGGQERRFDRDRPRDDRPRDDRPREDRPRDDRPRDDRPRDDRRPHGDDRRPERAPREEHRPAAELRPPQRPAQAPRGDDRGGSSFGGGLDEPRREHRAPAPRPSAPIPREESRPRPKDPEPVKKKDDDDFGGFGAGVL
jgi:putative RNA 2'-phosphotransferase